jgi:NAD(P)H-flavin reductase
MSGSPASLRTLVKSRARQGTIHTVASLNPIMVDGTGMCGGCRVQVNGEMKFACVDGPEFDAHKVDFKELSDRLTAYRSQEKVTLDRHTCRSGA